MVEEINRVVVDSVSELLFVPTLRAVENLRKEGLVEVCLLYWRRYARPLLKR